MTSRGDRKRMPRTAILGRLQQVTVGDVSRTGCRLTGPRSLHVGEVGMLSVEVDGEVRVELFRVSRCAPLADDPSLYESGVEFLPMLAGRESLHDVAARLDDSQRA